VRLLSEALEKVSTVVVDHVVPMKARARSLAESSQALVTVISPMIGYDRAAVVGKQVAKGVPVRAALRKLGYSEKEVEGLLDLGSLVGPGIRGKKS
ncbi:MAG TPA: hypothetical protein VEB67_02590, partial [Nitrososphaerales archaeon]|nr:hypothetical protein [Nitrososphaerales archaeon]